MTSKIVRSEGVTELAGIKSVVYTETVNSGDNLVPGCVASASIDVEVFGTQPNAPASDEALTYYQVDENGNETLIGTFYAEPSIPTKNTYKFIAYDAVSKLDKSFSERLNAIQNDFPMTVYDIVSEACTVAGVTLGSSSWPLSTLTVQAFYADGLKCRNILQYAAEIAGRFVRCDTNGEIIFDWYTTNSTYSIHPDSSQSGYIAYKQNGLTYDNFTVIRVDSVAVRPSGAEGAAYIYPTSFSSVTADDPNGDGNIVLQNLTVTDDGNGNLVLSVGATDANADGNVHVGSGGAAANTLVIGNNLLLMNASAVTYNAVAQNLYNVMSALPSYRHATVQLFTGENPFRAGEFVSVTDAQGVSFTTPIFTMKSQASHAEIRSSGNRTYQLEKASTEKALANLAGNIVNIEKLKVGWADIEEAIMQYLKLYGLLTVYTDRTLTESGGSLGYGETTYRPSPAEDFVTERGIALLSENASSDWDGESQPTDTTLLVTDSAVKIYSILQVMGQAILDGIIADYNGIRWEGANDTLYNLTAHDGYGHYYGGELRLNANTAYSGNVGGAYLSGYGVGGGSLTLTDANGDATILAKDIRKTLLWQNSDQSTFSATTLTSSDLLDDLSVDGEAKYNCFIITCHQTNSGAAQKRFVTTVCNMKDAAVSDSVLFNMSDVATGSSFEILLRQRNVTINRWDNTISFSTGYYSNNGTSGASYATTMVPISIYGMNI